MASLPVASSGSAAALPAVADDPYLPTAREGNQRTLFQMLDLRNPQESESALLLEKKMVLALSSYVGHVREFTLQGDRVLTPDDCTDLTMRLHKVCSQILMEHLTSRISSMRFAKTANTRAEEILSMAHSIYLKQDTLARLEKDRKNTHEQKIDKTSNRQAENNIEQKQDRVTKTLRMMKGHLLPTSASEDVLENAIKSIRDNLRNDLEAFRDMINALTTNGSEYRPLRDRVIQIIENDERCDRLFNLLHRYGLLIKDNLVEAQAIFEAANCLFDARKVLEKRDPEINTEDDVSTQRRTVIETAKALERRATATLNDLSQKIQKNPQRRALVLRALQKAKCGSRKEEIAAILREFGLQLPNNSNAQGSEEKAN